MSIIGNVVGCYSSLGKTMVLEDEYGNELTGVVVDQFALFDAEPDDVTLDKVFAGDNGVQVGTKHIPPYSYAIIDETGLCNDVCGTYLNHDGYNGYVVIPEYNPSYIGNYYNVADGKWYADAEFSVEAENI